jgi:hypothetical protein
VTQTKAPKGRLRWLAFASVLLLIASMVSPFVVRTLLAEKVMPFPKPANSGITGILTDVHDRTGLAFVGTMSSNLGLLFVDVDARRVREMSSMDRFFVTWPRQFRYGPLFDPLSLHPPDERFQQGSNMREWYFGWPVPFAGTRVATMLSPGATYSVLKEPEFLDSMSGINRIRLPWDGPLTRINWPSFLLNILAWQVLLLPFLAFRAFIRLRTRRRIKHHRCVQCAYSIAGLEACPECGTPAPALPTAPAT